MMEVPTDTRLVDCPECGDTRCYVDVPDGATIVDRESASESVETDCVNCGHEVLVHYTLA